MERTKFNSSQQDVYALEIFSSDAYFTVNKKLLKHYGPEVSIFLTNLIDKYKYFKNKGTLQNGDWFHITHEYQLSDTGLSISKLRNCKSFLQAENILEVKKKGLPAQDWYRINFNMILTKLSLTPQWSGYVITGDQDTLPLVVRIRDDYNIINNNKIDRDKINTAKIRNEKYLPLAKYLSNVIRTTKNITHTTKQINSWTNDIRQMEEDQKISYERIEKALQWYRKNIGGQYIPVVESGKSLKEKFHKLEAAMVRNQYPIRTEKCPLGWEFGKDYDQAVHGCMNCEDNTPRIYETCRLLHKSMRYD